MLAYRAGSRKTTCYSEISRAQPQYFQFILQEGEFLTTGKLDLFRNND